MARRRRETNAEIATTTPERRGNRTPDFLRPNEEPAAKVADAEQRSAAATSSDADTPTTTVTATATKNGDAADDDLRDRLASLQTMVEQLVAAQVSPVATSGDPEVDSASRTLRFAQQTADSVIAEAREEALAIVADAERLLPEGLHHPLAQRYPYLYTVQSPTYLGLAQAAYDFSVLYLRGELPGMGAVRRPPSLSPSAACASASTTVICVAPCAENTCTTSACW